MLQANQSLALCCRPPLPFPSAPPRNAYTARQLLMLLLPADAAHTTLALLVGVTATRQRVFHMHLLFTYYGLHLCIYSMREGVDSHKSQYNLCVCVCYIQKSLMQQPFCVFGVPYDLYDESAVCVCCVDANATHMLNKNYVFIYGLIISPSCTLWAVWPCDLQHTLSMYIFCSVIFSCCRFFLFFCLVSFS